MTRPSVKALHAELERIDMERINAKALYVNPDSDTWKHIIEFNLGRPTGLMYGGLNVRPDPRVEDWRIEIETKG